MFRTERDMVDLLKNSLEQPVFGFEAMEKGGKQKFAEINLGHGIADLVIAHHKIISSDRSSALTKFDISIYLVFERDRSWLTTEAVQERTKANKGRISIALARLVNEGFIKEKQGHYRFYRKYKPSVTTCIAIEAKLSNWKRALKQAYRYNWFSHYSYVILPVDKVNPAKENLIMFKELKVGLASLDSNGNVQVIYTPRRTRPYDIAMGYMLNENLLSKWLEETQPCA